MQLASALDDDGLMVGAGMIPFEQEFEHLQARMLFGTSKFQLFWEQGTPMPADLPDRIVKAMQSQGRISIAPDVRARAGPNPVRLGSTFSGCYNMCTGGTAC